jgi:3-isopropylmalate dehydratase small subunit
MQTAGAIGSITSAATVAASSFEMIITDPASMLDEIDTVRLHEILGADVAGKTASTSVSYVEPGGQDAAVTEASATTDETPTTVPGVNDELSWEYTRSQRKISGRVQTLGDFVDTDALAPAEVLVGNLSAKEIGKYCLYHTHPDFRRRVQEDGMNVVVAGKAFGVGSSRENAVTALQGAGVQCVIARSFAFIYSRNQPNLGLLGIVMENDEFYELAQDGADIEIDVDAREIFVAGKTFRFTVAELEMQLWQQGGMSAAFAKWGKGLLETMTGTKLSKKAMSLDKPKGDTLDW